MQNGDIATWETRSIAVVLEGVFCKPARSGLRKRLVPVEQWQWQMLPLKCVATYAYNNVPIDVITFLDEEVSDAAAQWFERYDVEVAAVEYHDYQLFCASLRWRRRGRIDRIVDSDPERLVSYGQLGYQVQWGGMY